MNLEEQIFAKIYLEVEEVSWETLKSNSGSGRLYFSSIPVSNAIDM